MLVNLFVDKSYDSVHNFPQQSYILLITRLTVRLGSVSYKCSINEYVVSN